MATPEIIAPPQMMGYINLVKADPVLEALANNTKLVFNLLDRVPTDKYDYAYAVGKWTVKQMLQHMIDCERVFALRTLWFARDPGSALPGFEENGWSVHAPVVERNWNEMVDEFKTVRTATRYLLESMPVGALGEKGEADNKPINALACGYVCSGHVLHHMNVLRDRYGVC